MRTGLSSRVLSAALSAHANDRVGRFALCCTLAYALIATLWVIGSALLAERLVEDGPTLLALYQAKGLALVAVTSALVYFIARWVARRMGSSARLLQERELLLSGIVDTAMDAVISVDESQRIVVFNAAAAEVFRLPVEQALGQGLDRFVPARLQAAHREHVRQFAANGTTSRRMGRLHRLVGVRADGEEFPMEASVSRACARDKVVMTIVLRDATERLEAERAHESRLKAEAASEAKTQFLARAGHELRTPLNAILGFSQLLMSQPDEHLSEVQLQQVHRIRDAGWHLLGLVNDLIDVSRIESGRLQLDCRNVDLRVLLDEAWSMTQNLARQHAVSLDAAYRDVQGVAWCDPLRMRQVLLNLLSNAVKYNRPGGRVTVELRAEGGMLCLRVTDTGIGMTQEQLAHLYEPFNRLGRERGGVDGTGIGLALTRDLVHLMHGQLHIRSTLGEGSCAELVLPLGEGRDDEAVPAAGDGATQPQELPTVLYIEDNPVNMLLVEQLLVRWPVARLIQADDGASGIARAREHQPDLVLLDMRLPDMSGVDVLAALKADPATSALRVVALSGGAAAEDTQAALRAGAVAYWTKPLEFEQFLRDLRRLLERPVEIA